MNGIVEGGSSKVPEVTLGFWVTKVAATTLGETGGDAVTMTLDLGYLVGTVIFATLFIVAATAQITAKRFHPFLYWAVIVATTTAGTTLADFFDRSLGIGYVGGSTILFALLMQRSACGTGLSGRSRSRRSCCPGPRRSTGQRSCSPRPWTRHRGAVARAEVEPGHVAHLVDEGRVAWRLQGPAPVRPQPERPRSAATPRPGSCRREFSSQATRRSVRRPRPGARCSR